MKTVLGLLALVSLPAAAAPRNVLDLQERALLEQDTGFILEKLGRSSEALTHYRAASNADPRLKAPWTSLARRALEEGFPERALHLASLALSLNPSYEPARQVAEEALEAMPPEDRRKELGRKTCPSTKEGEVAGGNEDLRGCLERRAGWLAGFTEASDPLEALARLDLDAGRPELAAFLFSIAGSLVGEEAEGLRTALARAGDPCGAAATVRGTESDKRDCEDLRARRERVEAMLVDDLRGASAKERESVDTRIEAHLSSGLGAEEVARRWRLDWRRGARPLHDLGGMVIRLGQEWEQSQEIHGPAIHIWRRRPGDSALIVFRLESQEMKPESALRGLLSKRGAGEVRWSDVTLASTDPISARAARVTLTTDTAGQIETLLWIAESPLAPHAALVIAGFPGTGGLGAEGKDQSREEILEAMRGVVLAPTAWSELDTLEVDDDLPVPVAGSGGPEESDERHAPWRILPAVGFTVAVPPGTLAALPSQAPSRSAPRRPSAALWFRSRFQDRDGLAVMIGDEQRAGSVDVLNLGSEEEARRRVLAKNGPADPPLADPAATLISALEVTRALSPETECSAAWIGRFRPSSGKFEWIVARLAYASRVVEIGLPVLDGSRSIALYWIPSTVRTLHGPPPLPPIDLSGRLGIIFVRPRPEDKGMSFYKEGDLKSSGFTLMVPRGFQVVLNSQTPDALPVKMVHSGDQASVRLERLSAVRKVVSDGSPARSDHPTLPRAVDVDDPRIEALIRDWLKGEGFVMEDDLTGATAPKPSRHGARGAVMATFGARRARKESSEAEPEELASGRALTVEGADGTVYVLLSLCWGPERARREEEIRLMEGSLRLLTHKKGKRAA